MLIDGEEDFPGFFSVMFSCSAQGGLGREGGIIFCAVDIVKLASDI